MCFIILFHTIWQWNVFYLLGKKTTSLALAVVLNWREYRKTENQTLNNNLVFCKITNCVQNNVPALINRYK